MGSPLLLIKTQALSSNRITLPSFLCSSFFALTTTACRKSPLRTLLAIPCPCPDVDSGPKFLCFWTTTMIRSPVKRISQCRWLSSNNCTYPRSLSLLAHDGHTFHEGGTGVVDAVKHRLTSHQSAICPWQCEPDGTFN